jgi:AcrR family transcriptional regulator
MPRVSPEHSEARRQQILEAARACFLRDGFHQTSMQDIQREAGLSAGAIYLYFKSKNDIIVGIAAQILGILTGFLPDTPADHGHALSLGDLIEGFLGEAERMNRERALFPLVVQIWAEAIRDPSMRDALLTYLEAVKARLRHLIEAFQAGGAIDPKADPEGVTMVLIGLGQGYIVQRALLPDTTLERYATAARTLLAETSAPSPAATVDTTPPTAAS